MKATVVAYITKRNRECFRKALALNQGFTISSYVKPNTLYSSYSFDQRFGCRITLYPACSYAGINNSRKDSLIILEQPPGGGLNAELQRLIN